MAASDTILITGGAGYIGSHLARLAHDRGSRVVAIDSLGHLGWPKLPSEVVQIVGDIERADLVLDVITKYRPTSIVHLAGKISVTESIRHPAMYWRENFVKTIGLLDIVSTVIPSAAFVLASSAAVYGAPSSSPISETAPTAPITPYGASKLACEHALAAYGAAYDLPWAALRFFNVAGAHPDGTLAERHDPETHLIPLAIDAARGTGPPLTIYGDGSAMRDYVHVMNVADACLTAIAAIDAGRAPGCLNVASGHGATANAVIEAVERTIGRPVPHVHADPRDGEPRHLVASVTRTFSEIGWAATTGLRGIIEDAAYSRTAR